MYAWLLLLQFKLQPYRLYLFIIYTTAPPDWFLIMSRLSLLLVVVLVAVSSAFVPHGAVPRSALSSSVAPAFAPRADPLFAESEDMTWEGEYPPSKVLGPIMSKMPSGLLGMLSTGDALNEVHDRSQTAFTQLARLGTTLVTGLMSAADSFTPEALREWVGELLDVVRERVRSECDALVARTKGRLARFECQRRVHPGGCVGALFGKSR